MIGFPFLTSLVVTLTMVVAFSLVINKGAHNKHQLASAHTDAMGTAKSYRS